MRPEFLKQIKRHLEGLREGWIADIPAGDGSWWPGIQPMENNRVILVDVRPPCAEPKSGRFSVKGNCDECLPIKSNTLDAVISIEGIEHILDPHHLAREFYRVLKPGGKLLLTTPNIASIPSRLQFMLRGKYAGCTPIAKTPGEFESFEEYEKFRFGEHVSPLSYARLAFVLTRSGFEILEQAGLVIKSSHRLLMPVAALLNFITQKGLKRMKPEQAVLRKIMNRPDILLGKHLWVCARKPISRRYGVRVAPRESVPCPSSPPL